MIRSLLRFTAGIILVTIALMILFWPVSHLSWSMLQQSGRSEDRILWLDEHRRLLMTVHTQGTQDATTSNWEIELRSYDCLTGMPQSFPLLSDNSGRWRPQVQFSEDRSLYAVWSTEKPEIVIYKALGTSPCFRIRLELSPLMIPSSVTFSPDGSVLAVQLAEEIHVWNLTNGQLHCKFVPPQTTQNDNYLGSNMMQNMSISSDNCLLAISGQGKGIAVYHLQKKYLVGQVPQFGIPRFVSTSRLAVLPRRGEKKHAAYYAIGEEYVTTEEGPVPLPPTEVAVSTNSRCYYTVTDSAGLIPYQTNLPAWVPDWIQRQWVDWFSKGSITVKLRGYDIITKKPIMEQSLSIIAYTHPFMVMPGTQNQLVVSESGRIITNNDTHAIWVWEHDSGRGIMRWLGAGFLTMAGAWLSIRPRWFRRQAVARINGN
ncbi:MAG: WD40 repeat domain-containing protein [Planctomycetia bacterium]|nr:WD40 repeat domain-containing protein [Planctomycetia bacterium]